mgnify:CR=1 FL=1
MIPVYTGKRLLAVSLLAGALAGCASTVDRLPILYKPEIRQGTFFDAESVGRLEPGMTQRQVSFVLGPPTIEDPFSDGRWDYVYEVEPRSTDLKPVSRKLTLFFDERGLSAARGSFIQPDNPLYEPEA